MRDAYRQEEQEEGIAVQHVSFLLGQMSDVEQSTNDETENDQEATFRKLLRQPMR